MFSIKMFSGPLIVWLSGIFYLNCSEGLQVISGFTAVHQDCPQCLSRLHSSLPPISVTTMDAVAAVRVSFPNDQPSRVFQVGSKSGWMMVCHINILCCFKHKQICLKICLIAWLDLVKSLLWGLHWAALSPVHETSKQIMSVLGFCEKHYIK